jgi:hypothetical protein
MEEIKKTAGEIMQDLMLKDPEHDNHLEIIRAQEDDYIKALNWCVDHARGMVVCNDRCQIPCGYYGAHKNEHFFVEVSSKQEQIMPNYIRNFFQPRKTCPMPFYDQTVWKYDKDIDGICYVWSVPDWESSLVYLRNAKIVDAEEHELLKFVLAYYDGTLARLCRILNGEEIATNDHKVLEFTPKIELNT